MAAPRPAGAVPIRVRGVASIEGRVVSRPDALEIRGVLKDDSGRPVDGRVRATLLDGTGGPARPSGAARTCLPAHPSRSVPVDAHDYVVEPDGTGSFCIRVSGAPPGGVVRLAFAGDRYYAAASTDLAIDASRRNLVMRFNPEPRTLALDRPTHALWIDTNVEPPFDDADKSEVLQLKLFFQGRGASRKELGSARVRAGERALFEVRSADLGAAGPGRLDAVFAGSPTLQAASRSDVVQRSARVSLSLAGSIERRNPQDGIEIRVAVGSVLGAVPGGSVEAIVAGESVGTAPVSAGAARVVAVFDAPNASHVPISLHYLPDAPWWTPGDSLDVVAPVAPPGPWRRLPWVLGALAVAIWLVRGWRRPAHVEPRRPESASLPPGRPSLEVIERGPSRAGWRGRVVDAHDGTPIPDARVALVAPGFAGSATTASVETDADGSFALPHADAFRAEGARMVTSARWHAALARPVPPPGNVVINLVARRRALLDGLVAWARHADRAWSGPGDPTPGHLADAARKRGQDTVANWAEAVEQAAYGADPPDEATMREIEASEPRSAGPVSTRQP